MAAWYARPVLFVSDVAASVDFYAGKLGFAQSWRYVEDGLPLVAQVEREGCELILSGQEPMKVGSARMFISLASQDFQALPAECAKNGVLVTEAFWGYRVLVVGDPDGNQLYFPDPTDPGGHS